MTFQIIIREEADADSSEAYDYYEEQKSGLGDEFLMELIKRYDNLVHHPLHYSFIEGQEEKILRDLAVDRFPYVIIFEVSAEEVIVYAVHNTYRRQQNIVRSI